MSTPSTILAAKNEEIVMISAKDGRLIRTIADRSTIASDYLRSVSATPDGKTVFFARQRTESCFEIVQVQVADERLTRIGEGSSPAVSPDGKALAYSAADNCGDRRQRFVTRDLATGKERSWEPRKRAEGGFGDVAWSPDPRYLLVQECGFDSCMAFRLDTERTDGILSGPWYGPPSPGDENSIKIDDYQAAAGTFIVRGSRRTLVFGVYYPDEPPEPRYPMFEFDPRTGSMVAIMSGPLPVRPVDFDPSGDHLLFMGPEGELFRYDGNTAVSLGSGFSGAAW